jgi:hypothetical protein
MPEPSPASGARLQDGRRAKPFRRKPHFSPSREEASPHSPSYIASLQSSKSKIQNLIGMDTRKTKPVPSCFFYGEQAASGRSLKLTLDSCRVFKAIHPSLGAEEEIALLELGLVRDRSLGGDGQTFNLIQSE